MRQPFRLIILVCCVLPSLNYAQDCVHTDRLFRCVQYVKNYDGDTVTVNIPNIHAFFAYNIAIRLRGIDAPEIRTKNKCEKEKAIQAKQFVQTKLETATEIELRSVERGKYFRIIADLYVDGLSLSTLLLEEGLAVAYEGGTKPVVDWCLH